jgi:transposase
MPSVFVHIKGEAPLKATVYERTRLRCNLCGEILTPQLPEDVGDKKHDESAAAMVAVLKYGCGMPLNRLEKLQDNLKNPVAASTQWDILNAAAITLSPVLDALVLDAAQGEIIHNDDTTAKILSFIKEQDPQNGRTGIFTTGIVSRFEDHRIALFMTGDRHAGENLNDLLQRRATGLCPPIQMCDALSRNASKDFETIMANCLVHARRQFVELVDRFPDDCAYVIEQLGKVYHHDAVARQQQMSPDERLAYHQLHSTPVMEQLQSWCNRQIDEKIVEPNSGLGKAIRYMLRHWEKLTRFLQVPGAPLDNNICERALKHAVLHRKNALFFKTRRGAQVGDLFMSLIHTCQLAGVNPWTT